MTTHLDQKQKPHSRVLGLAIATMIGAAVGVLFAPQSGKDLQEDIVKKAKNLAQKFNKSRKDIQASILEVFGEVNDELEQNYIEIRGNILATLDDVKEKAELTKDKYSEIIDDVIENTEEAKKWPAATIKKLKDVLLKEWNSIKNYNEKRVPNSIKKAANKLDKKVSKAKNK